MSAIDQYPNLFSPSEFWGLSLPNRAVVAPMTRTSATSDGMVTDEMVEYYRNYSTGGWSLIITEATYIDKLYSQGYSNQPGIADDEQAESWRKVVDVAHQNDVPIFAQIFHAGAVNQGNNWIDGSIAPSAVRPINEQIARYNGKGQFQVPREITQQEIDQTVEDFAKAATRAVAIGFDGIEIHGANGYLPDQFLTTYTNKRDDDYGGSLENRFRYHVQLVSAVRKAIPESVPLGIRLSQTKVNDLEYTWPNGAEDAAYIFSRLGEIKGLYIHLASHLGCAPVFGTGESLAGLARRYSGHPVMANGKLNDPTEAERILSSAEADFVSVAKGALADPAWADKIRNGLTPLPFDPGMITPLANLANTRRWRVENDAS